MPKRKRPEAEQLANLRARPPSTGAEWCATCAQIIIAGEKLVPGNEHRCSGDIVKSTVGDYLEVFGHAQT